MALRRAVGRGVAFARDRAFIGRQSDGGGPGRVMFSLVGAGERFFVTGGFDPPGVLSDLKYSCVESAN